MLSYDPKNILLDSSFLIPDSLWLQILPLLPPLPPKKKSGRPRSDDRLIFTAISYLLRTGCQWLALPRFFPPKSTVHARFHFWALHGFFLRLWQFALLHYDSFKGIDWLWQAIDGSHSLAPLGGQSTGPSFKHHFKPSTTRSLLTDRHGIPIGLSIDSANTPDMRLASSTLLSIPIPRPIPSPLSPQHLCADKGYDYPLIHSLLPSLLYTPHIARKHLPPPSSSLPPPKLPPRRWVVERTHAWMNFSRRIILRWEKLVSHYLAFAQLSCAFIIFKSAKLL